MKNRILLLMITAMIFTAGCGEKEPKNVEIEISEVDTEDEVPSVETTEEVQMPDELAKETEEATEETESSSNQALFKELKDLEFYFSSGAGGWRTVLYVNEDGTFTGEFSDSEMGSVGEEYPNGTYYISSFDGEFGEPLKINDYTYSLPVKRLAYSEQPGVEEIKDGVLYSYSTAYGIENAEELLLYTQGAPIKELPQGYRDWILMALENPEAAELPFYGIYNEKEETGFSSYKVRRKLDTLISDTEYWSDFLKTSLANEDMNQMDLNEKAQELYQTWDDALNAVWKELKSIMPEAEFEKVLKAQRQWIKDKEAAIEQAASEVAGGSMEPMVRNLTAAEYTEKRVYELLAIYKQQ